MTGYGVQATQGSVTWGFIAGAVIYAGSSWISFLDPIYVILPLLAADAVNACWIGMKKNGLFNNPAQIMEEMS